MVGLQYYPFRKFKIKKEETEHRAISAGELRKVSAFEGSESENRTRDIARLMFLLFGITGAVKQFFVGTKGSIFTLNQNYTQEKFLWGLSVA